MGLPLHVGAVHGLAGLVADLVRLVERLQRVEGDLALVQCVDHDEPLPQAERLPVLQRGLAKKLLLRASRDAVKAPLSPIECTEAVAGPHEAIDDAADGGPGHVQFVSNLGDGHPHLGEVLERAVAVKDDPPLVVPAAASPDSLIQAELPVGLGSPLWGRPRPEVRALEELLAAQGATSEKSGPDGLVLSRWHGAARN